MFLQILGAIFLVILCVIAYFGWKAYRFIRKQTDSDISKALAVLPSQDMDLEPSTDEEWQEQEKLARIEAQLKQAGASHIGYFCVYSGYATIRVSLWDFKQKAAAAIYEGFSELDESNVSFIYEVASKLDDGSVCITSNPNAELDSRPVNHRIIFNQSDSILDFLKALKSYVPEGKKLLKISEPKQFFLDCYEDTTEWAWRKEQLNSTKTQQTLASVGVDVNDQMMDDLIDMGIAYSVEVNSNRARRKLAKHTKMSVDQWEEVRDKLVIVNERMRVYDVVDAIYDAAGDLTDKQEKVIEGFRKNTDEMVDPIAAFQMLSQSLNLKLKRITRMRTPVKTEIYLPL